MKFGVYCAKCGEAMHECHEYCRNCGHVVNEEVKNED